MITRHHNVKRPQRHIKRQRSQSQVKRNKSFRSCCTFWRLTMTNPQRNSWTSFAENSETNYNAFLRLNIIRSFNDLPILATPPVEY